MKNEKNVAETLRRILWLKQDLKDITEIKKKAFEVFDDRFELNEMESHFEEYWRILYYWTDNINNVDKHFGQLYLQGWETLKTAFAQVQEASVNRKVFADILEESRKNVERYIKELEKETSQEEEHLSELYDKFANNSEFDFVFKEPLIKQSIINEFLKF